MESIRMEGTYYETNSHIDILFIWHSDIYHIPNDRILKVGYVTICTLNDPEIMLYEQRSEWVYKPLEGIHTVEMKRVRASDLEGRNNKVHHLSTFEVVYTPMRQ